MVKEIRDAAQIRENVLFSKVEALVEKCASSKNMVCNLTPRNKLLRVRLNVG